MRALVTWVIAGLLASGCASEALSGVRPARRHGLALLYADPPPSSARDDREALARAEETPTFIPRIPHQAPRVTSRDPGHASFDDAAARAAIHALDPSSCTGRGAPPGYGHARLTFEDGGRVSEVVVDQPPGMTADAVACVQELLERATVPPFEGGAVTLGASYLVRR